MKVYLLQEHLNNLCKNVKILNAYTSLEDAQREQAMLEDMYNNERISIKEKHLPDKKYYSIIGTNLIGDRVSYQDIEEIMNDIGNGEDTRCAIENHFNL